MNARRKQRDETAASHASARRAPFPPNAYDYDGDVSEEVLQEVQSRANVVLEKEEWVIIDGYVGDRQK